MTTPTSEPSAIVAGDTITWQRSLADYPATAWTLKYRAVNAGANIQITGTASGTDHLVNVAAGTSAAWAAGTYDITGWVENGGASERHTVYTGRIEIKPNLATQTAYDARSTARKIHDALVAAYKTAVDNGQAFVGEYEIGGRRMKFDAKADWIKTMEYWKRQVAAEERAANIAAGRDARNRLLVRF